MYLSYCVWNMLNYDCMSSANVHACMRTHRRKFSEDAVAHVKHRQSATFQLVATKHNKGALILHHFMHWIGYCTSANVWPDELAVDPVITSEGICTSSAIVIQSGREHVCTQKSLQSQWLSDGESLRAVVLYMVGMNAEQSDLNYHVLL